MKTAAPKLNGTRQPACSATKNEEPSTRNSPPRTEPVFDAEAIMLQRRMRFNPLRMLTPENLSQYLDQFDIGNLNLAARLWDAMARRDDTLAFLKPQSESDIAAQPWGVFLRKGADPVEAARHKACLDYFYDHVRVTDAFDRNVRGGRHKLIKQMMSADSNLYSAHHFVWEPKPGVMIDVDTEGAAPVPALAATLEHVPLQYFENNSGTLRFLPLGVGGLQGEELDWENEWMCATGRGIMFAASICYVFKRLTFQDWTNFNERYANPKVLGQTNATKDSPQGQAMAQLIAEFNSDMGIVLYETQPGTEPPISLLGPEGTVSVDLYDRFLKRQDAKLSVMYRGSDRANEAGEKQQNGITAQMDETTRMQHSHCQEIADAAHEGIDRKVIRFCCGEGVEPLAYFGLPDMEADEAQEVRESAGFLADRGAKVDLPEVADRLGITLTEDDDSALQSVAAAGGAQETDETGGDGLEKTANSATRKAKLARLEEILEETLRTANAPHYDPEELRNEIGRWTADASAGTITPEEARARLTRGIDTTDVLGTPVRFDEHILEHWSAQKHRVQEQERRLRRLPDAVAAIETPHEVWKAGDKQTVYLRAFTDDQSKKRYMGGFIMENGKARTFFHFSRSNEIQKLRKGERIYARP